MVADGFEPRIGGLEVRVAVLEQIATDTRLILERMDKRLDRMDERLENRFDRMDDRLMAIDAHHRADFRWLLGLMLAGFAGLLGAMAHGFHWL
jgi:uncharacterized coiled-coil protein SlyX